MVRMRRSTKMYLDCNKKNWHCNVLYVCVSKSCKQIAKSVVFWNTLEHGIGRQTWKELCTLMPITSQTSLPIVDITQSTSAVGKTTAHFCFRRWTMNPQSFMSLHYTHISICTYLVSTKETNSTKFVTESKHKNIPPSKVKMLKVNFPPLRKWASYF